MLSPEIKEIFIQANGLRLQINEAGEGDKLALLLHGFPETNFSWRYQIPLLTKLGYRVWAPNLRGYGQSSRPLGVANYAIGHLVEDVAGLIDVAQAEFSNGSTLLVGHDWGGVIAWAFAIKALRPLRGLVIMNAPHPVPFRRALKTLPQLLRSWYMFAFQIPYLPELLLSLNHAYPIGLAIRGSAVDLTHIDDAVIAVYRDQAADPGALTAMLNYYRALRFVGQQATVVDSVTTPTLMVWGEADVALSKATTIDTETWVGDLTMHFLPGVSHWVQQEAPDQVNEVLTGWLTERQLID